MRFEKKSIATEAELLTYLSGLPPHGMSEDDDALSQPKSGRDSPDTVVDVPMPRNFLYGYLPLVIKHGLPKIPFFANQYILSHPTPGTTIAALEHPLEYDESESVQFQIGQLVRRIACHTSPTGKFGDVEGILKEHSLPKDGVSEAGFGKWSEAFYDMLEDALRDLEDRCIQIGYQRVRNSFFRLRHLLDAVTRPSLVAVEGGASTNVLIHMAGQPKQQSCLTSKRHVDTSGCDFSMPKAGSKVGKATVSGLRSWSNCIFGDPLFATVFLEDASASFLSGLAIPVDPDDPFEFDPVIEDPEHTQARLLLYECYHAIIKIGRDYYQPRAGDRELSGRKQLKDVLGKLNETGDDGHPISTDVQ